LFTLFATGVIDTGGNFPPVSLSYPIWTVSNFFTNLRRYSQVKVHPIRTFSNFFQSQGAPPVATSPAANFATSFARVVDIGGKFATSVNDTGGNFPPVSLTPEANLPSVSFTLS
jgi:hypothetical protein